MQTVRIEPPLLLEGIASGELEGRGLWQLSNEGSETIVRYDWNVQTAKQWMKLLAPIARPVFKWNHDVVMSWGAKGLGKRLGVSVAMHRNYRHGVGPSPRTPILGQHDLSKRYSQDQAWCSF